MRPRRFDGALVGPRPYRVAMNYGNGLAAFGIVMILVYIGVIALGIWVQYLIIKAAVRNGIGEAMAKYGLGRVQPPQPTQPPASPYQYGTGYGPAGGSGGGGSYPHA